MKTTISSCLFLIVCSAAAFERADGSIATCVVNHQNIERDVNEIWLGKEEKSLGRPMLGGAAAVVRRDKHGVPSIYFDWPVMNEFRDKEPHMVDFIFYHECAHAYNQNLDEFEANCEALIELNNQGLLDNLILKKLAASHQKMKRLPQKYGGNGSIFWDMTIACVENKLGSYQIRYFD